MKKKLAIALLIIFIVFLVNAFHEEYPDEYDSIVGGKFIIEGKVPYRDWFQHHQPGAYVLSALILPFSGINFVKFRMILAAVFFLINAGGFYILKKRVDPKKINLNYYLIFLLLVAVSGTFFWWQMLLADTLAAYLLLPAYALLILKEVSHDRFSEKDLLAVSVLSFFGWWTSMTYIYLVAGINIFAIYLYLKSTAKRHHVNLRYLMKLGAVMIFPYAVFFVYLILTGSLKDYYFANFTYNQSYYIYNAVHAVGQAINPVRYAVTIAMTFFNNFLPAMNFIKDFNVINSIIPLVTIANVALIIFFIIRRKITLAVFVLFSLIYASARSDPGGVDETNYQASVYAMISFFNGVTAIYLMRRFMNYTENHLSEKIITSFLFILLFIHSFSAFSFLGLNFMQKYYQKYMGLAPLIYNRPQVAPIVNLIASQDDYAWVGPFEFKDLFYLRAKMPSRYHWFLQHAVESKIAGEMIADFQKNKAKVIVFQRGYSPWGGTAHDFNYFFTDFLDKYYFRISDLNKDDKQYHYRWKIADTLNFNLDQSFNFDRERKPEIIDQLLQLNLIEKTKI